MQMNKGKNKKRKVFEFNLSLTLGIIGAIAFIILAIVTVKMIATQINSNSESTLVGDDTEGYSWVESTEIGEDGSPIKVPVPDGYTASQIPGETTVSGGFVIYEGDVDWTKIEDLNTQVTTYSEEEDSNSVEKTEKVNSEENRIESNTSNIENKIAEKIINEVQETEDTNIKLSENKTEERGLDGEEQNILDEEKKQSEEEKLEEQKETNNTIQNEEKMETLAEEETPTTIFELQSNVNQYVWVPVKDVSRIYGIDSNGKLWGKSYLYSSSGRSHNTSWSENSTNGVMSITNKEGSREPDIIPYNTNYDIDSKLQSRLDGIEQYQLLAQQMEENFYKTIESIKKYGGFYIGRYETGNLGEEKAVVQKMNEDIGNQDWYTMYEKCKGLAGTNENVITLMIWGSLWDETLQWLVDSGATISTGETIDYTLINNSTNWGNHSNAEFYYVNGSGGTSTKNTSSSTRIPTGSTNYTKVNNIYDIAGNVFEYTLEANLLTCRNARGGGYYAGGNQWGSAFRMNTNPNHTNNNFGCRSILLIK